MTNTLSCRYGAAFVGQYGHVRVHLYRRGVRKCITTPLQITADQRRRLSADGYLDGINNAADQYVADRLAVIRDIMADLAAQSHTLQSQNGRELSARFAFKFFKATANVKPQPQHG